MGLKLSNEVPSVDPAVVQSIAAAPVVKVQEPEMTAKELAELRKNAKELTADAIIAKKNAPPVKGVKVGTTLAQIMAATAKKKGEGIFMVAKDVPNAERIPTGIFELDLAMGGGFPKGRYSIINGLESSCKTTLALLAIAQAQKLPDPCNKAVFIDLEGTFDPKWASMLGVDIDLLTVVKPGYGEEAGDIFEACVRASDVAIIVLDSLACMVSTREAEQSLESFDVGTAAILVKRMVNKAILALAEEARNLHFPALILINQIRYKIGVMFGNPETTPGGKAKDFASSMTLRVSGKNKIVKDVNPDIHSFKEMSVAIKKAKVPVVKQDAEFDLCVYAHDGMSCGETKSWNTVKNNLQQMGALTKAPKGGWSLLGVTYSLLDTIQTEYESDNALKIKLQKMVIDSYQGEAMLLGETS